ncbi:hypothetical protein SERLA73DRAFT_192216 [Serpula lacrymans var. lacrymans S7.3]|uniref:Uncharacterized protein n=1 Tax=Serpula lacrymans var. lacrymans (strain S7.3) TaxID=936435 RepID=F8QJB8_SERL3|nr:hypothetical protein SERLA73DRAFT_192216 [Serpula lacrymans var. lacrymans S7.3]
MRFAPVHSGSGPSGHATNQYAFQVRLGSLVGKAPDHESWSPRFKPWPMHVFSYYKQMS